MSKNRRLIIITGLAGAGKTVALHTLEDAGFYCIDNMPIGLLKEFGRQLCDQKNSITEDIAVNIDTRNPEPLIDSLPGSVELLKKQELDVEMIYMEASEQIITSRYSETRRKHPLSSNTLSLEEAVKKEYQIMQKFAVKADLRIDTSRLYAHQLRMLIRDKIIDRPTGLASIQFISFGYKNGVPKDADFVFDVRYLPNPYWQRQLRQLTGKDPDVAEFMEKQQAATDLYLKLKELIQYWIEQFEFADRSYLCFALGCTGGRHRSVYLVEKIASHFKGKNKHIIVNHRELNYKTS